VDTHGDKGFTVLGFPCNQFARQEPGTNEEIKEFVKQYNVTFPLFDKIDVNGPRTHPLYKWLKDELPGTLGIKGIKWNFSKFSSIGEESPSSAMAQLQTPSPSKRTF